MENSVHIPIRETLASAMKQERRWKSHPKSSISSSCFSSQSGKAPLIMGFLSCLAWLYIAGRLWQDAENRMVLSSLLQKNSANIPKMFTVEDKLRNLGCNEIGRKIVEAEMDLTLAKSEGYLWGNGSASGKKLLAVIGVYTGFGSRLKRNVFRGSWMPRGDALRKLEERGVVIRFVIGRSANRGDSLDRNIDDENRRTKDFLILESHEEAAEELPRKAKFFFSAAVETWDAEFYIKVDDNINIDLNGLIEILESRRGRQGLYMGCMKSGNVITEEAEFEYEKGSNIQQVEQMQGMEKNLISMAREVEKLRVEILNAEKRAHAPAYTSSGKVSGYADYNFGQVSGYNEGAQGQVLLSGYSDSSFAYAAPAIQSNAYGRPQNPLSIGATAEGTNPYTGVGIPGYPDGYGRPQIPTIAGATIGEGANPYSGMSSVSSSDLARGAPASARR